MLPTTIDEIKALDSFEPEEYGTMGRAVITMLLNHIDTLENRANNTVYVAQSFAQIDGAHHKMWTIDKMLRELLGKDGYVQFVKVYEEPYEGVKHEWETGIAP